MLKAKLYNGYFISLALHTVFQQLLRVLKACAPHFFSLRLAGILRESELYEKLEAVVQGQRYVIYGDPAYPLRPLLMKPYGGALVTRAEESFNKAMSTVRQAVEWGFGKIISEFAFLDFKKNQKIMLQAVPRMYRVATLLTNCHACMYGNQVSSYFDLEPPSLSEYLSPAKR